jgi:hypothetical protein
MTLRRNKAFLFLFFIVLLISCQDSTKSLVIIRPKEASQLEKLAAKEIRRYLYLRTGQLVAVEPRENLADLNKQAILVCQKERYLEADFGDAELKQKLGGLGGEEYLLKTFPQKGRHILLVAGGDAAGTLYGAYRLAEKMGVRFYLHGDVVPDRQVNLELPVIEERGQPLFRLRGIQPFHDFPEGPDWWNAEEYKAILAQVAKLRMNFFGLHTYPEGRPNAEPTVWIGLAEDSNPDGTVRSSYPSSYQNTLRGNWGYEPTQTRDYYFGASELFETDAYGADVMKGMIPEPKTLEDSNEVFNRTGALLRDAFDFGRALGIKTCVGTETPLTVPEWVKKRLRELGKNPADPKTMKEVYKGLFTRVKNSYPLDYYWLWTDENWTWSDASEDQVKAVTEDARMAIEAAGEVQTPFALATCGWVLGPPSDRTLFDGVLPKDVALSCINREVGKAPVDPMFARISGRSKWAIPWLEDDPALTSPQLWAGRMRRDAADALAYGCDGLLGIHWRTRILSPNVSALAAAAWDQSQWGRGTAPTQAEGPINGVYVSFPQASIAGTSEEPVYRDIRDRVSGYHLKIPNGTYDVVLKFCEGEVKEKGRRVFDIFLQGKKVLEKLDIFSRSGAFRALDLRFRKVAVQNGRLEIDFADRIHYPSIAGIEIVGEGVSKKINCGGPAYQDYESDWPETPRYAQTLDFYEDWAAHQIGPEAGPDLARIFAAVDGRLPQPNIWTGPGGLKPDPRPWEDVKKEYQFVDEIASLQPKIMTKGNQERFAYWLNSFLYMREMAQVECLWAEYDKAVSKLKAICGEKSKSDFAVQTLLPIRDRMVGVLKSLHGHLLATVSTTGELGTVANWQQHLLPALMLKPGAELQKILGRELPVSAQLPKTYDGPPRIIIPAVRTMLRPTEPLNLKVIILSRGQPDVATLNWREMGIGKFRELPLRRVARGVYQVSCPGSDKDLEYYVKVQVNKEEIYFPSTAPLLTQTVVRME